MLLVIGSDESFAIPASDKQIVGEVTGTLLKGAEVGYTFPAESKIEVSEDGSTWLLIADGEEASLSLDAGAFYLWFKTMDLQFKITDKDGNTTEKSGYDLIAQNPEVNVAVLEGSSYVVTVANSRYVFTGVTADYVTNDVFNVLLNASFNENFDWTLLDIASVVSNPTTVNVDPISSPSAEEAVGSVSGTTSSSSSSNETVFTYTSNYVVRNINTTGLVDLSELEKNQGLMLFGILFAFLLA